MSCAPIKLAILGSTGSIGCQALEVVAARPDRFEVVGLAAGSNRARLLAQARRHGVERVALGAASAPPEHVDGIEILSGPDGLVAIAARSGADLVLAATVGAAGFAPTVAAIEAGADIALASKELLVMAGQLLMGHAARHGVTIRPVDSEHSAIWQCLWGEGSASVARIILTASGGPFRTLPAERFDEITLDDALAHPTWQMGPKITVDSATLMNKGLEVIEAGHLFAVDLDKIAVLVHPQSVVHSLVEFVDGSCKAQLGPPDMRIPIACALGHYDRLDLGGLVDQLDLAALAGLEFFRPDDERFPLLGLCRQVGRGGGSGPAVLVGADDAAVAAFLRGEIRFDQIAQVVLGAIERTPREHLRQIADVPEFHRLGFAVAEECIRTL